MTQQINYQEITFKKPLSFMG